ncbi:DUF481 domain-containing protein [Chitinophaga barathri]|nr:DUF481 domain-containing protein [Chitinophaga barathri]
MFTFLFVLLYAAPAFSQFSDSTHYYIKYASTGAINKTDDGNSYLLNNAMAFKVSRKKISLNADASYLYGQSNGDVSNNDFTGSMNFSLYPHGRNFYYWGLTGYDKSYSLKINNRFQGGAGAAWNVISKPNATLNVSDGILFESSDLLLHDTIPDVYHTFRNSLRIYYKWTVKNIIVLEGAHFLQQSLQYSDDYIIKSTNALSVKLRSWLAITAVLNYNRITRTDRENLFINYGLTIEKYF